jgi:hypothetical protein
MGLLVLQVGIVLASDNSINLIGTFAEEPPVAADLSANLTGDSANYPLF